MIWTGILSNSNGTKASDMHAYQGCQNSVARGVWIQEMVVVVLLVKYAVATKT